MTDPTLPSAQAGVSTCYRHPDREAYIRCQRCDRFICPDCMRPAAVGFQCPECVKEGSKETRSGRTAYGGLRPTDASITSMVLIAINVGVWIAILATGGATSRLVSWLALQPRGLCVSPLQVQEATGLSCPSGSVLYPGVSDGAYWQLVTSMFTHVQLWHIGFNMLALWVLGPQLEAAIGRWRFVALYFLSGLAGSALVYWGDRGAYGASGAIFGLMGALLVLAIKIRGDVRGVVTWIAVNFVITFVFVSSISWEGHVGGFVGGTACGAVLVFAPRGPRRTAFQVAGLTVIALLIALAIVVRSATID
jgi:membrane associated rhomboid family serine protease